MSVRNHTGNHSLLSLELRLTCLHSKAKDLFQDEEELLQHAEDCGFDKTPILIKLERLEEAAETQLKNGLTFEAIELLIRANTQGSMKKAAVLILDELWLALPYNQCITPQNQTSVARFLDLSNTVIDSSDSWIQEARHCLIPIHQHLTGYIYR